MPLPLGPGSNLKYGSLPRPHFPRHLTYSASTASIILSYINSGPFDSVSRLAYRWMMGPLLSACKRRTIQRGTPQLPCCSNAETVTQRVLSTSALGWFLSTCRQLVVAGLRGLLSFRGLFSFRVSYVRPLSPSTVCNPIRQPSIEARRQNPPGIFCGELTVSL